MENFLILRAGQNFRRGSGITIEEEAAMCSALCLFLNRNTLLRQAIPERHNGDWEGFELRAQDLTAQGLEIIKCGFDRWMKALDSGKSPSDMSILDRCLTKVTGGQASLS